MFVSATFLTWAADIPEKPENLTSFEIQKRGKDVYKAGLRVLGALKYEIKSKKRNKYLHGLEGTFRIFRIRGAIKNGRPINEAEGTQTEFHAHVWIEGLSKKSCQVGVSVVKKEYDVKFDKDPKLTVDIRVEDREEEIKEKLKKSLKVE
jgi:hypothetical protein